jgi:hypothetical protein
MMIRRALDDESWSNKAEDRGHLFLTGQKYLLKWPREWMSPAMIWWYS